MCLWKIGPFSSFNVSFFHFPNILLMNLPLPYKSFCVVTVSRCRLRTTMNMSDFLLICVINYTSRVLSFFLRNQCMKGLFVIELMAVLNGGIESIDTLISLRFVLARLLFSSSTTNLFRIFQKRIPVFDNLLLLLKDNHYHN